MLAETTPPSDLVQIVTILGPIITAAIGAFIVYQQLKQGRKQDKLETRIDGHMTAMLAQKDEIIKVTGEAELNRGRIEGAQEKKAEIRADALEAKVGVAATDVKQSDKTP